MVIQQATIAQIVAAIEGNAEIREILASVNPNAPDLPLEADELGFSRQMMRATMLAHEIATSIQPEIGTMEFSKLWLECRIRMQVQISK